VELVGGATRTERTTSAPDLLNTAPADVKERYLEAVKKKDR
jgi:hypothetical protein